MVIKGRGKFPEKKKPEIPPPTKNISKIASLTKQPASDKALELLHEIATLVTPIMHHYNFKVGLLCEMYPKDQCLLGLNVNRGQKICLRLRSPTDSKWFLERDEIVGTMLHELTHNWHGPHDATFYKVLDDLKDKYLELQINQSMQNSSYPNNFSAASLIRKPSTIVKNYTTRVSKVGTEIKKEKLAARLSMRELMLKAAERRLQDAKSCTENEKEKYKNVPNDSELCIIDVISLDSDDEGEDEETKAKKELVIHVKKEIADNKHDVICLD